MLSSKERSVLRSKCNTLKPAVNIGKGGLTANLLAEVETVLFHREIIKIGVLKSCSSSVAELTDEVCQKTGGESVAQIGGKFVVYKRSDKKEIEHLL